MLRCKLVARIARRGVEGQVWLVGKGDRRGLEGGRGVKGGCHLWAAFL